jgi:bifunctional DNA-binding transcriptional regulator/antitoxin component of YhaV-PrlF toxin-antitoxin module
LKSLYIRYADLRIKEKLVDNTFQIQVVRRGVITLPKEICEQNQINEGDTLTLIDLGNSVFMLSPRRSRVDEIADQLAKDWQQSGDTLESTLETLREVRSEYDIKKP